MTAAGARPWPGLCVPRPGWFPDPGVFQTTARLLSDLSTACQAPFARLSISATTVSEILDRLANSRTETCRAALEDAFIDGRVVAELRPKSKAAHEITASWKWIVNQL